MSLKLRLRNCGVALARRIGTRIVDAKTGEVLGKALILPWRGKIHVIGLEVPVRLVWLPQKRLTYWKQQIGFVTHPPPDFPSEARITQPVSDSADTGAQRRSSS